MSITTENSVKMTLSEGDAETSSFYETNPDFDLARADLFRHRPAGASNAVWAGLQRQRRMLALTEDGRVARRLVDAGLDLAHRIAAMPVHRFVRTHLNSTFDGDEDAARAVHGRAVAVKAAIKHVSANIQASLASPHYGAMLANNVDRGLADYFQNEPSYQDLFGSLNYCKCQQCASIFGPAAYFLDLMRITDDYITDQNKTIPPGYALAQRRPDLFDLPLTCANTDHPVPTLQIVNEVLARAIGRTSEKNSGTAGAGGPSSITLAATASGSDGAYNGMSVHITGGTGTGQSRTIASYVGTTRTATVTEAWHVVPDNSSTYTIAVDPYQTIAVAPYPFNLPANLPLTEIRTYLGALNSSLEAIHRVLSAPATSGTAQTGAGAAITLANAASPAPGAYVTMALILVAGTGNGQVRVVTAYDGTTKVATVDRPWAVVPDKTSQYVIYDTLPADREAAGLSIELYGIVTKPLTTDAAIAPYYGYKTIDLTALAKVETFESSTGLNRDQLQRLLTQGLSEAEVGRGLAGNFFINRTGENLPPMAITIDSSAPDTPFYRITNLSLLRLDRINRFIRLAAALGWDYESLDWAIQSIGATEITEATIKALAGIRQLQKSTSLSVIELCAFWAPLKTLGRGNGAAPADLFDRTFNSPPLLKGLDPYTSVAPIPFDPTRPLVWTIDDASGANGVIRGRLLGALNVGDDDLTRLARILLQLIGGGTGPLSLTLENLSWLYRLAKAASIFGLSVVAYLTLLRLMYFPNSQQPPANVLVPSVANVLAQLQLVTWFTASPFSVYAALYILTGEISPFFTPAYRPDGIASLVENLSTLSAGTRLTPQSFVYGTIGADQAEDIFARLVHWDFITPIGVLQTHADDFTRAASLFPFDKESFITGDIDHEQSARVFLELQKARPPVLLASDQPDEATLSRTLSASTSLDFLFSEDPDGPNKRREVLALLTAVQTKIHFVEFRFLFVIESDDLVSNRITKAEADRTLQLLSAQSPSLMQLDRAAGQSRTIQSYAGATRTASVSPNWSEPLPSRDSVYLISKPVTAGTAQDGSILSLKLAAAASAENGAYVGMRVRLTGGTGAGQAATVVAYDGAGRIATIEPAWVTLPDTTSTYAIDAVVATGTAFGGAATVITLDRWASPLDESYDGMSIELLPAGVLTTDFTPDVSLDFLFVSQGAGQSRAITAYDGRTRTATVASWNTIPDSTSVYQVIEPTTQGSARGGTAVGIVLADAASPDDNFYNGMTIALTDGTGAGQVATISSYVGATRTASVQVPWATVPDATSVYAVGSIVTQGTARAGSVTSIALAADAASTDGAYKDMIITLIADPAADVKRGEVRQYLANTQLHVVHSDEVIDTAAGLQLGTAMQGVADFLGTAADRLAVMIPLATAVGDLNDYLVDLLTPLAGGPVPADLPPFIAGLSRSVVTFDSLAYTIPQIRAVAEIPQAFVIGDPAHLTLADLAPLTEFRTLVASFGNQSDRLIDYLRQPPDPVCPGPATQALSALTQWPASQICKLEALFWPAGLGLPASGAATIPGLARLAACFGIGSTTGLDIELLLQLDGLGTLPVGGPDGIIAANWQIYRNLADSVLAAASAKFGASDFVTINANLSATLNEARRNALLEYAIWSLHPTYSSITSAESLYQYLLIDVEMCGCDITSRVAQAIAAVQLYMQRCRMMVEPGVTDLSQIPDAWWEWMSAYRVWEANRRIFLYPENYIDPALRQNTSPQFKDLVDALTQTDISDSSVTNAYQTYFQGFCTVAQLSNATAYSCLLPQPGTSVVYAEGTATGGDTTTIKLAAGSVPIFNYYAGMTIKITKGKGAGQINGIAGYDGSAAAIATVTKAWTTVPDTSSVYVITGPQRLDTLFLVASTATQPPIHHWRRFDAQHGWTPWTKVGVSIPAAYVSPVYAFDKLLLFWAEVETVRTAKLIDGKSLIDIDIKSNIRFSYDVGDGTWLPAQTTATNIVFNMQQSYDLDPYVLKCLGYEYRDDFAPKNIHWQKAYPIHIGASRLMRPDQYPNGEQIFVNYGLGVTFATGPKHNLPTAPVQEMPPDQYQLEITAFDTGVRYNDIVVAPLQGRGGYLQMRPTFALDGGLASTSLPVALFNVKPSTAPEPYRSVLNRAQGQFGVSPSHSRNLAIDNYKSDDYPDFPLGQTETPALPLLTKVAGKTASVVTVKNNPGAYLFDNFDEAFLVRSSDAGIQLISEVLTASASLPNLPAGQFYLDAQTYTTTNPPPALNTLKFSFSRITTAAARALDHRLAVGGIADLLTVDLQVTPELPFGRLGPTANAIGPATNQLDFDGAYGLYFWEIFFHGPLLVAQALAADQRFREAKAWLEYIFNPTQLPESGGAGDKDRFWRFLPFRGLTIPTLTQILANPAAIAAYNDDPFDPDAIARLRISAYAKAVVMKYIANLLAWGDYLFAQDTRESINEATNLYVMASDLLGPRPVDVGNCRSRAPLSFNDIKQNYNDRTVATGQARAGAVRSITLAAGSSSVPDAYTGYYIKITGGTGNGETAYITAYSGSTGVATVDPPWTTVPNATSQYRVFAQGIPEFLIKLESSQMIGAIAASAATYSDVPFNDVNSYFCVPENSELMSYWDQVADRLYKIRHCMNLAGVQRPLALFAPPINPRALIQAGVASGGALSVAAQPDVPIPAYRFAVLIAQARGLAAAVTQLGAELLAAIEKKDSEALAQLRTSQEKTLLQLTTLIKEQQVEQVKHTALALNESLLSAKKRQSYYDGQINDGMSTQELNHIAAMTLAALASTASTYTRTMATIAYMQPNVGSPFAMTYGGAQIGASMTQASGVLDGLAMILNFAAQLNLTMAGYGRRRQEWSLQYDLAGYDVAQVEQQILANQTQLAIVNQDLRLHQTSIAQNGELDAFFKRKFTNADLYQWMATRLSVVYFQAYSLALDLARSAQRAWQFETNSDTSFVNFGYWDSSRRGLLAGEGLMLALNQMEKAYLDNNRRGYEIDKTVSLLQLNPRAMLEFIATGECIFELPEKMFDDDFPGHYCRKIRALSVSIPTIVGPYQNLHATLTQLTNQTVVKPDVNAVNFLLGGAGDVPPDASVLRNNWWANQSIALSRGLSDTGVFDGSGADGRYLPFEGTGAVSTWRLSMPKSTNHLDYQTITDVILQVHYTALDGGARFRQDVTRLAPMRTYAGSDFFACAQRFSTQWYQFLQQPSSTATQTLSFTLADLVPKHVDKAVLTGFYFQLETAQGVDPSSSAPYIRLKLGNATSVNFAIDREGRYTHAFQATPRMPDIEGPASVSFDLAITPSALKRSTTPQYLDPAAIKNVVLILFYEGEINWS